MVRSSRHATHRHRQMHKVAIHNFPPHAVDVGGKICSGLVVLLRRARQRQQSQKSVEVKGGTAVGTREEVKARHGGEEVSHFPFLQSLSVVVTNGSEPGCRNNLG